MTDYGDQIILGTEQQIPKLESDTTNFLQKLVSIASSIPGKAEPLSFEKYITEVKRHQQNNLLRTLRHHSSNGKNRGAGP